MPASRDSLAADFRALGVRRGDLVMLHASLRSLGPVHGGPDAVLDALMGVVGDAGGLIMFVSWGHSTYDAFVNGDGLSDAERAAWPAFDPPRASVRDSYAGAVGACLVGRPDAARSANPDRSLAALGRGAAALVAEHRLDHGFGPGSPLERFVERGGKTLLLGAPLSTATVVHLAEYRCAVPDKLTVAYEVPLLRDGDKRWCRVEQMERDGFVPSVRGADEDHIERVVRAYLNATHHQAGRVGEAPACLLDAADLVDFAVADFERHYGGDRRSGSAERRGQAPR